MGLSLPVNNDKRLTFRGYFSVFLVFSCLLVSTVTRAEPEVSPSASIAVATESTADAPLAPTHPLSLETALQSLNWPQFRSVVEAIPKLRAEVDAYGAFGWEFVKRRYTTHRWRKSVGRLDEAERQDLLSLIEKAQADVAPSGAPH